MENIQLTWSTLKDNLIKILPFQQQILKQSMQIGSSIFMQSLHFDLKFALNTSFHFLRRCDTQEVQFHFISSGTLRFQTD